MGGGSPNIPSIIHINNDSADIVRYSGIEDLDSNIYRSFRKRNLYPVKSIQLEYNNDTSILDQLQDTSLDNSTIIIKFTSLSNNKTILGGSGTILHIYNANSAGSDYAVLGSVKIYLYQDDLYIELFNSAGKQFLWDYNDVVIDLDTTYVIKLNINSSQNTHNVEIFIYELKSDESYVLIFHDVSNSFSGTFSGLKSLLVSPRIKYFNNGNNDNPLTSCLIHGIWFELRDANGSTVHNKGLFTAINKGDTILSNMAIYTTQNNVPNKKLTIDGLSVMNVSDDSYIDPYIF